MLGRILSAMFLAAIITFFSWLFVGNGHEDQLRQIMLISSISFFFLGIIVDSISD